MTPFVPEIAVFDAATGAFHYNAAADHVPPAGLATAALPSDFSDDIWRWNPAAKTFAIDPSRLEAKLIAQVKAEADRLKLAHVSPGDAKDLEYSEKAGEFRMAWTLGGTLSAGLAAIGLMSVERRAALFPQATADAAAFGDTVADALRRFGAGIARSALVARINAFEQKACADIRATAKASDKQSKFDQLVWPAGATS